MHWADIAKLILLYVKVGTGSAWGSVHQLNPLPLSLMIIILVTTVATATALRGNLAGYSNSNVILHQAAKLPGRARALKSNTTQWLFSQTNYLLVGLVYFRFVGNLIAHSYAPSTNANEKVWYILWSLVFGSCEPWETYPLPLPLGGVPNPVFGFGVFWKWEPF